MDHDPDEINSIVLPLLNVSRPMTSGQLNENEPHQVQIWISSASDKNTFCYDKTIELMELAIINPRKVVIFGWNLNHAQMKILKLLGTPNVKTRAISSQAA